MAVVATGELAVTPDLKGFESKMSSSLGGIAKKAALAFGGAFAATKAVDFLGSSIADARESNKIAAQTAAAIKSTGGAANVTAKQVDQLASSISRKTGIDDEAIAKASNLLLTFTGVRNEVGKGNDIFNQATKIAADMGAALGTDAAGSAIQLGKALNDPIKGISALTRVGVTFTDAQKEQIKGFVEAGDVASAQKVILAELAKEFGGSAAAQATAADRLKVTFGNLKEDLGNKLIPILDKLASFLADKLPGALDTAGKVAGVVVGVFTKMRPALETVFGALQKGFAFVMEHKELLVGFGAAIAAVLVPAFVAWAVAAGAAAIATIAAAAPVIAVAAAVGLVVAALVYAYNHWTLFREVIQSVVGFVTETLIPAFGKIVDAISVVVGWLKDNFPKAFEFVKGVVTTQINIIKSVIEGFGRAISTVFDGFRNAAKAVFNAVARAWNSTVGALSFKVPGWVPGLGGKGWDVPNIPVLHQGGMFQAPFGQSEGLALLKSGERVLPPGASAGVVFGPGSVVVQFSGQVSEAQAYTAGQAVGRGAAYEMERAEARRAARVA